MFLINSLQQYLETNPYFSAGFGLTVMATGLALGRQVGIRAAGQIKKRNTSTLEITNKDSSYIWVLNLLDKESREALDGGKMMSMLQTSKHHVSLNTNVTRQSSGYEAVRFEFMPSLGKHIVRYNNTWIAFERERQSHMTIDIPLEIMKLTVLGRNTRIFKELLHDAMKLHDASVKNKTIIYTNYGLEWRQFGEPRTKRPIHSVILHNRLGNKILDDVKMFIDSSQWYIDRGIPYRRGYLLHGQPGSGKSSFIFALAGELNYNVCVLNLNERGLTDDRLALAMSCIPPHSLVLLEDIDVAFPNRDEDGSTSLTSHAQQQRDSSSSKFSHNGLTFSGLLNVLDGVIAGEERIVFMTTNHIKKLDSALIRPGRVDIIEEVGCAQEDQIINLFLKFFPHSINEAEAFTQLIKGNNISMAAIQGHFMKNRQSPQHAIKNYKQLMPFKEEL